MGPHRHSGTNPHSSSRTNLPNGQAYKKGINPSWIHAFPLTRISLQFRMKLMFFLSVPFAAYVAYASFPTHACPLRWVQAFSHIL